MGTKEIALRNPDDLFLSSIYNSLVMNTVTVCGKIIQQGKLFSLRERENITLYSNKGESSLKSSLDWKHKISPSDTDLMLGSLKLVCGTSDKDYKVA